MNLYKTSKYALSIFLSLSIINSMSWLNGLYTMALYGKIALVFMIIILYFFKSQKIQKVLNLKYLLLFLTFIIVYSFLFYYDGSSSFFNTIFRSIMLASYIMFIYYIVQSMYFYNKYENNGNTLQKTIFDIAKIFQKVLLINIILWLSVAIILGQNLYDIDITGTRAGFAGFTGDRQTFGLLMAALYLSSLILNTINKSKTNLSILILSFIVIIYTDSRTSEVAVILPTIYIYLKNRIKNLEFYILPMIFISIYYIVSTMNFDINEYSSGRILVWSLFIKEIESNNIFYGYGLFNFNDIILHKYINMSYYFRRIDFLYFHSSYIEIFAAGGILAVISYLIFVIKAYMISSTITKACIIGIALASAFESFIVSPVFPISLLFWTLLILESINNISKDNNG